MFRGPHTTNCYQVYYFISKLLRCLLQRAAPPCLSVSSSLYPSTRKKRSPHAGVTGTTISPPPGVTVSDTGGRRVLCLVRVHQPERRRDSYMILRSIDIIKLRERRCGNTRARACRVRRRTNSVPTASSTSGPRDRVLRLATSTTAATATTTVYATTTSATAAYFCCDYGVVVALLCFYCYC